MNSLAFEIIPSPTSTDHQVRIQIDGTDWLGNEYLGIDPPHFFAQTILASEGKLLVGRCQCGCEGCDDVLVDVFRDEHQVCWTNPKGLRLHFNKNEYDKLVHSASKDYSWEDTKRKAERLVSQLFTETSIEDGFIFDWASARIKEGIITLSFSRKGSQKLFEFGWNGNSPDDAVAGGKCFYKERLE